LATARDVTGSGNLTQIYGAIGSTTDADLFRITMCNPGSFSATTVGPPDTNPPWLADTQLFLFDAAGTGIVMDDDDPAGTSLRSRLTAAYTGTLPAGIYYLGISGWDRDPYNNDTIPAQIWADTPYRMERGPDAIGVTNHVLDHWADQSTFAGNYIITLTGACFTGGGCYVNCDHSAVQPCLNVLDFGCFLNKFAAGDTYANCDGSTQDPVLNVLDFGCFLNRFASGCSSC
jgi:hypothetical protein